MFRGFRGLGFWESEGLRVLGVLGFWKFSGFRVFRVLGF